MSKKTTKASSVSSAKGKANISRRDTPIFTYKGWAIYRWDDLNIKLTHDEDAETCNRFYSTLGAALHGLVKQIGFKCQDLNHAVELLDGLNKRLTRAGL